MIIDFSGNGGGGSGSGGSVVSVTQVLSAGTNIAAISVDGVSTNLYAPSAETVDLSDYYTSGQTEQAIEDAVANLPTMEDVIEHQNYQIIDTKGDFGQVTNAQVGTKVYVKRAYSALSEADIYVTYRFQFGGDVQNVWIGDVPDVTVVENGENDYSATWRLGSAPYQYFLHYEPYDTATDAIETPESERWGIRVMEQDWMTDVTTTGATEQFNSNGTIIDVTLTDIQTVQTTGWSGMTYTCVDADMEFGFTYWPDSKVVYIPVEVYTGEGSGGGLLRTRFSFDKARELASYGITLALKGNFYATDNNDEFQPHSVGPETIMYLDGGSQYDYLSFFGPVSDGVDTDNLLMAIWSYDYVFGDYTIRLHRAMAGGGSVVNVTQLLSAGTPSATITVDGQATTIYSNEQEKQNYQIVNSLNDIENPVEGMVAVVTSAETDWVNYNFVISDNAIDVGVNYNGARKSNTKVKQNSQYDFTASWRLGTPNPGYYDGFLVFNDDQFINVPIGESYGVNFGEVDFMTGVTQSGVSEQIQTEYGVTITITYLGRSNALNSFTYIDGAWVENKENKTEYYTWDALTAMTIAERTALKDSISAGTLVIVAYQNGEDTEYHFPSQMNYTQPQDEDGKWLMWRMEKGMGRSRCLRIQWNTTEYLSEDEEPSYPPQQYKIADGDETIGEYEQVTDPNTPIYSDFETGYMIAKKGNNLPPFKYTTVPRYSFDFELADATDGDVIFTLEDGNGQIATVYYFDDNGTNKIGFSAETQDYDWITDGELDLDNVDWSYSLLVIGQKPYTSVRGCIGGISILIKWNSGTLGITVTEDAYTEAFSEDFSIIPNDQLEYGNFNDEYDFSLELEQSLYLSEPVKLNDYEYDYEGDFENRRLRRINPVSSDQIRNIVKLTQAEYDELVNNDQVDQMTLYLIEEE